jgi:ectoine hydroxylase-related dioxygenase (phytanoyl-CoA dioxygenase family)
MTVQSAPPEREQTPSDAVATALERDGAAVVRGVVPGDWIDRMRSAIDAEMAGVSPTASEYGKTAGRFYGDFFLWLRNEDFRDFAFTSPLPALAAGAMRSTTVNLLYDQLFVKEPGSSERTPWHQDLPYWPVEGTQILSIWVPLDVAGPHNGVVTYVKGSHLWGQTYRPQAFDERNAGAFAASPYAPMPDIDADAAGLEFLSWSLEPGDVLIHKGLTIHGASGNRSTDLRRRALAVRYTGDDARYSPRPGTFMEMDSVRANVPAPGIAEGAPLGGALFPRVWPSPAGR